MRSSGRAHRLIAVKQLEALFKQVTRPEQVRFDRAHRQAQHLGNLFIRQFLEVTQDQNGSIFSRQRIDGLLNMLLALMVSDQRLNLLPSLQDGTMFSLSSGSIQVARIAAALFQYTQAAMIDHAIEPGGKTSLAAKGM